MYSLAVVLMVLVCFNFIMKQTWYKQRAVLLYAAFAAMFTGLMWPLAVRQSSSLIEKWISSPAMMLDTSAVITVEVMLQTAFCLLSVHVADSGRHKRSAVLAYRVLKWFPGVLIFAVLFCFLVYMVMVLPGVPFRTVACIAALAVFVSVTGGTWVMRRLFPDMESRLEMFFIVNALTALVAVIATVNGRTAVAAVTEVDYVALSGVAGIVLSGVAAGFFIKMRKSKKQ